MKMSVEHWWNDTDRGNRNTGRKTGSSATVTNKNLIRTGLTPKLSFRSERPATDRLSHDTVVQRLRFT